MDTISGDPFAGRIDPNNLLLDVPDIVRRMAPSNQFDNYLRIGGREGEQDETGLGIDPTALSILRILSQTPQIRATHNPQILDNINRQQRQQQDNTNIGIPNEELNSFILDFLNRGQ